MAERVFCQITSRDISTKTCVDLQHSHDAEACFGCGACSRLCDVCRHYKPVNPEIGLCCSCLGKQLEVECEFSRKKFEKSCSGTVLCQIIDKHISGEVCLATQGDARCSQCPSRFRLCEECSNHQVYYPQYGLCLTCALGKYGKVWLNKTSEELANLTSKMCDPLDRENNLFNKAVDLVASLRRASTPVLQRHLGVSYRKAKELIALLEKEDIVSAGRATSARRVLVKPKDSSNVISFPRCSICQRENGLVNRNKTNLCIDCARKLYPETWTKAIPNSPYRELIMVKIRDEIHDFVRQRIVVSASEIGESLAIGVVLSSKILDQLEQQGVVGPHTHKLGGHPVLINDATIATQGSCSQCNKNPSRVILRGSKLCINCARQRYSTQWTRGLANSRHKPVVMDDLYQEARKVITNVRTVSVQFLMRELVLGRHLGEEVMEMLYIHDIVGPHILSANGREVMVVVAADNRPPKKHTSSKKVQLGYAERDPLYEKAKLLVVQEQNGGVVFLSKKLRINHRRSRRILRQLSQESVVSTPPERWGKFQVLVARIPTNKEKATARIRSLVQLRNVFPEGETAKLFNEIISDLRELQRLRSKDSS